MRKSILVPVFCAMIALAGCGGSKAPESTAAATTAAPETAAPETSAAPETTEAEEETEADGASIAGIEEEEPADANLSKEGFIRAFDFLLEGEDKSEMVIGLDGKDYGYDELGDLYEAIREKGGSAVVSIQGEEEELDFETMTELLKYYDDGWFDTPSSSEAPSKETIDRFFGDWHGVCGFRDCTGKYKDEFDGKDVSAIARFRIDDNGDVEPFIGVHVEDTPIENLTAVLDAGNEVMYLSGSWIGVPFDYIPMWEDNGTLHAEIPIEKEEGSVTMVFNFRHLNDINWDGEDPRLPEDLMVNCQGWSFEQLVEANGYSKADYPDYLYGTEPEYPVQLGEEEPEEQEDFGKTTKDADGIVSLSALKKGYASIMDELDKSDHEEVTYERVRDWFGADGVKDMPYQWDETQHCYEWLIEDEKEWVSVIFAVEDDGKEILRIVNQSNGILESR